MKQRRNNIKALILAITIIIALSLALSGIAAAWTAGDDSFSNPSAVSAQGSNLVEIYPGGAQAGHYLQWKGKPILLIGDSVTQGWMESGKNFNIHGYVDALAARGINVLMIWSYMGTSAAKQQSDTRIAYDAPELWSWAGSPDDQSFDLTQFNPTYFEELKKLVSYAESKSIVVLITLHDGWTKGNWDYHPFNAALGNGPLTDKMQYVELADYGHEMPVTYNPSWDYRQKNQYFQERFADKIITELQPYSNVIYEMFNEGNKFDQNLRNQHEQHFLAFFRARCSNLLLTNTDHIEGDDPHNDAKVDVVTLHGDWTNRFNDFQAGFNTSPAKPYLQSEPVPGWDGTNLTLNDIRRAVWEVSLAGSGWVSQNDLSFGWDPNAAIASQASLRDQAYDIAGHAARFFNQSGVNFANMRPNGSLSSTGVAMAQEGIEYVVYSLSGGSFTLNLSAASGRTFAARWYNPRTGQFSDADQAQGGGTVSFNKPDSSDWVLHLLSSGAPIAYSGNLTTTKNTSASGTLNASDPDGDPLTYRIVSNGTRGTATITDLNSGSYTYAPNTDAAGNDSFTFVANDGKQDSNVATISIAIQSGDPLDSINISNLNVSSGRAYQVVNNGLSNGALAYIDRDYTYSGVPDNLLGATYIKTANDDKDSSDASILSFDVDRTVTVYVAHDDRITSKPQWMISFTDTGEGVQTDTPFSLYKRNYAAGRISLGGNQQPGTPVKASMYTVILLPSDSPPPEFFADVPEEHWAYPYIKKLYEDGYIAGCSTQPLLFCTGKGMNRAEAAVFVTRGEEGASFQPVTPAVPPFADVFLSDWFVEWVEYLMANGYSSGCGVNSQGQPIFCPYSIHTRAEAAVFFYRVRMGPTAVPLAPDPNRSFKYADVPADNSFWFNKWIYGSYDIGVVGNCEDPVNLLDNLYRTDDEILREEAACMMYHAVYGDPNPTPTPTSTLTPTPTITPTPTGTMPTPTSTPNPDGALQLGEEVYIGNGTSPDIAVDGQGVLHIVYDHDSNGITYVRVTSSGAGSPISIGPGSQPRIAIDSQNRPHVVYISDGNDVMYTRWQDSGFINAVLVYDYSDRTEKPRVAVDKRNNNAIVLYEHVGIKEGSDPETAWTFYYHIINNSGSTPVVGSRIHPPTNRSGGYVEQSAAVVYDSQGTAHYLWRDWGDRSGSRGLHYQNLSDSGQYSSDQLIYGSISDFSDLSMDPAGNLYAISTTGWATDGLLYATNKGGSWSTQMHFRELFADASGNLIFDPDHNVPAIAYDPGRGLAYIAFTAGETDIHHSFEYIDSYIAYVDANGNFSQALLLHDENRASGGKYNGVRIAPAANKGVFAVIPVLREGESSGWEIILRSVGGAQVGLP